MARFESFFFRFLTASLFLSHSNSKLTYILQNSLGGNAKTLMLCNVSPSSLDVEETNCSLQFASRVRATELGVAGKNVSASAPAADKGDAATGSAAEKPTSAAAATPVKRPVSAATGSPATKLGVKPAAASALKKPGAPIAPSSATKKPIAK